MLWPRRSHRAMAALSLMSVVGCVLMWNIRRSGFHFYAIAQLLMLVLPLLFLGTGYLGLGDVMFTALFLLVYYLQLKGLGAFDNDDPTPEPTEDTEQS